MCPDDTDHPFLHEVCVCVCGGGGVGGVGGENGCMGGYATNINNIQS